MAPRTRVAQAGPEEANHDPEPVQPTTSNGIKTLQFNETLTWRAGSKLQTGEILRRLKALAEELKDHDQEEIEVNSLTTPAKELVSTNLLDHKDPGVRAFTACCLADVLRLCAPAAPFTASQLKALFTLFVTKIIPALADAQNPYNVQHQYVLQSLAQVKSIVLITDVQSPNALLLGLFTTCFDILSSADEDLARNLEYNMTGLLSAIIEESQDLPNEVVETILAQFLRADPAALNGKSSRHKKPSTIDPSQSMLRFRQLSPAYNMAKNICRELEDRMARYVSQYFSTVIMSSSSRSGEGRSVAKRRRARDEEDAADSDEYEHGPDEEGLNELTKAHQLLRELWRAAPSVLHSVIPPVEAELGVENVDIRLLATETIGDMASGIGAAGPPPHPVHNPAAYPPLRLEASNISTADGVHPTALQSFSQTHATTYSKFLGRRLDKSPVIRAAWTKALGYIISTSAGGIGLSAHEERDLAKYLSEMLVDHDEKVRLAAVEAIATFELKDIITKLGGLGGIDQAGSVLCNLAERIKDRKIAVRTTAALLLGQLWGEAYGEIASDHDRVTELFGLIPTRMVEALYVRTADLNGLVDRVIFESLWPLGYPTQKKNDREGGTTAQADSQITDQDADKLRTERLLMIVRDMEPKARGVFSATIMARPKKLSEYMKAFLKRCEDFNGGVMDANKATISAHLNRLIDFFAQRLPDPARAQDDLLRFAKLNDRRNYNLIRFCLEDASDYKKMYRSLKELNKRLDGLSTTTGTMPETITSLLYLTSNLFYNRSHVHPVIYFSQSDEKSLGVAAHELLKEITTHSPGAFKAHAEELCRVLQEQAPKLGRENDAGAADNLKALASFAHRFPGDVPSDRNFLQALTQYTSGGSSAAAGKYAVSVIMSATDKKDMYAKDLLHHCVKGFEYGSSSFMAKLAALSQLMLVAYGHLDEEKDVDPVVDIAINQILLQNRIVPEASQPPWEDVLDQETEAKLWALKILVNRLRAHDEATEIKEIATPVYQLLNKLVKNKGELASDDKTPQAQKSRLRLQASISLLKLSSHKDFDRLLNVKAFNNLATVAQDSTPQVREFFLKKLTKYLGQDRLPSRFYPIVFLLAFEPSRKLREDTVTWIKARSSALTKAKRNSMDLTFARFLSLLVHHPDFDPTDEELENLIKYIMFYLRAVATEDNLSLIMHAAQQVKGKADAIDPSSSDHLYYLSDLAVAVITQYEEISNWSMQACTGQLRLPTQLFIDLPDDETRQEVARKQYLPAEFQQQIEGLVKGNLRNAKKRKSDTEADAPAKKRQTHQVDHAASGKPKSLPVRKSKKTVKTAKRRSTDSNANGSSPPAETRRSSRGTASKSYIETADSEDDAALDEWNEEDVRGKSKANTMKSKTNGNTAAAVDGASGSEDDLSEAPETDEEG